MVMSLFSLPNVSHADRNRGIRAIARHSPEPDSCLPREKC